MKASVKILICSFMILFSGDLRAEEAIETEIEKRNLLFGQALSIFTQEKVPHEFLDYRSTKQIQKCATWVLFEARNNFEIFTPEQQTVLQNLFVRPVLPLTFISSSGFFKIHYTVNDNDAVSVIDLNGNGIPDFIEEVADAFDNSYQVQIDQLGYQRPPDDFGIDGPEYDVYIQNLGGQFYGFNQPEEVVTATPQNDFTSFVVIDNDFNNGHFTPGLPGAFVTAAHEYFHAIQFSYRGTLNRDEAFYYEICSVWMEDVVYNEINDYYQYLPSFFSRTDISFNAFDGRLHYLGEALWYHFLVKKFNDFDLVRRTWEIMQSEVSALAAVKEALIEKNSSFSDEFTEFAIWNYFTGSRANSIDFYDESGAYPEIALRRDITIRSDTSVVDSSLSLTHQYFKFTVASSGNYTILGSAEDPDNWSFAAIVTPSGGSSTFRIFSSPGSEDLGPLPESSEIVIVAINQNILDGANLTTLNSAYSSFNFRLIQTPEISDGLQGITAIYPNPFEISKQQQMNVEFAPIATIDLEARILNSNGQVLKTCKFADGCGQLTFGTFVWDGTDKNNNKVPSGVYLIQLKQGDFVEIRKFAVIRD